MTDRSVQVTTYFFIYNIFIYCDKQMLDTVLFISCTFALDLKIFFLSVS